MFLLFELLSGNLMFGMIPESGALLLCGVSLIGGTAAARRFLKYRGKEKIPSGKPEGTVEDKETR